MSARPERWESYKINKVVCDSENLRQLVDYLRKMFPGLRVKEIADLSGLKEEKLHSLLGGHTKYISEDAARTILSLNDDLETGKKSYTPRRHWIGPADICFDRGSLRQFINYLRDSYSELTIAKIAAECCIDRVRLNNLLCGNNKYIKPEEVSALFELAYQFDSEGQSE